MKYDTSRVKSYEKISSLQPFNNFLYAGDGAEYASELFEYITQRTELSFPLEKFALSAKHTPAEMVSSPVALSLLRFLMHLLKPRVVVEIGTFIGFTTTNLAACLSEGSKIISFEKFAEFAEIAEKNVSAFGVGDRVEIIKGDAKETMQDANLVEVDLVFIDGNKEDYLCYFQYFEKKLSKNGVVIIDDCFFHGDVLNSKNISEKGRGVSDIMEYVSNSEEFVTSILPISNGMTLVARRN